ELIADHLKAEGFSVATAAGGGGGVKVARGMRPTPISVHLVMAHLGGWGVVSPFWEEPWRSRLPATLWAVGGEQPRRRGPRAAPHSARPAISRSQSTASGCIGWLAGFGHRCRPRASWWWRTTRFSASGCADGSRVRNGLYERLRTVARRSNVYKRASRT